MTYFRNQTPEMDSMYHGKFVFLNAGHSLHKFAVPMSPKGVQEYDFEFKTPEWLPPSCIYSASHQSSNFKIRYGVWAQILPLNMKHFTDAKKTISCFRSSKEIFLYRPPAQIPTYELKAVIETKVGGLMGFGGSVSKTTVVFDKN